MIHNPIRKALPDLSNPGAADDLRSGKQLVGADGSIVTGTLPEVIQATPTISVSSGGLITASATQSGGIVAAGSKSATQQLTTQGAKTVTPGTTTQTAVASGRYVTGDVDVAGDANLVPENIAQGVSIFGVVGTHSGGAQTAPITFYNYNIRTTYVSNGIVKVRADIGGTDVVDLESILVVGPGGPASTNDVTGDVEELYRVQSVDETTRIIVYRVFGPCSA